MDKEIINDNDDEEIELEVEPEHKEEVVVKPEDKKAIMDSIIIEGEEDSVKQLKKQAVSNAKHKSLTITDEMTKELYSEFNAFLEEKVDVKQDEGIKLVIPTGIDLLDAALGGGFAVGAMNIIVGQPGSGKSMLAMQVMANAQRIYGSKGLISAYLDSETATTSIRLANLGVRNPRIKPYTDVTIEKIFKIVEGMCLFKLKKGLVDVPSVVVWDSIANTLSQKEMEAEDMYSVIGYKQKLLSFLVPKYISKCGSFNICMIAVNQLRDTMSIGQFAPPKDLKFLSHTKDMPGGNAIKFNAFQLVEMKVKSATKPEKVGFDGFIAKVKMVKNKLFVPNVEVEIVGDFVRGFNNFYTNYNFLVETKRVQTGAWNTLENLPEKKFRTKDANKFYDEDEEFKIAFDKLVKETIHTELIEKHTVEL